MQKYSVIFFGTHEFAVTILEKLLTAPHIEVLHVVTQPDEPVGRKHILTAPPVKILASSHNIPVSQPSTLKSFVLPGTDKPIDLHIVAQYGKIIPKNIIEAPNFGTLNVHTSLLPKYRGASPIQFALLHGETETGVTIMKMDEGMDTGPILLQKKISIFPDETYLELNSRMADLGAEALLETIPQYIDGSLLPLTQEESEMTLTKLLSRDDGKIDWTKTSSEIYNQFRALTPWPGIWTTWEGKRLKLLTIRPSEKKVLPGIIESENNLIYIGTSLGSIEVSELQLEGKNALSAKDFLSGYRNFVGSKVE
jgi:methionyl-tRNA formyltransferase